MINSRQRAQLRAMANGIETIIHVGEGRHYGEPDPLGR